MKKIILSLYFCLFSVPVAGMPIPCDEGQEVTFNQFYDMRYSSKADKVTAVLILEDGKEIPCATTRIHASGENHGLSCDNGAKISRVNEWLYVKDSTGQDLVAKLQPDKPKQIFLYCSGPNVIRQEMLFVKFEDIEKGFKLFVQSEYVRRPLNIPVGF